MGNRWAYMADPRFNPPCDACEKCREAGTSPSKVYFIGGKTVDGKAEYRYACEHHHEWTTNTKLEGAGR